MALRYTVSASLWPTCNAATSCSAALSVISLMCSDFIFRSPVRGFGSLTSRREPKDRVCRRTEEEESAPERKGNRSDTWVRRWRDSVPRKGVDGVRRTLRTMSVDYALPIYASGLAVVRLGGKASRSIFVGSTLQARPAAGQDAGPGIPAEKRSHPRRSDRRNRQVLCDRRRGTESGECPFFPGSSHGPRSGWNAACGSKCGRHRGDDAGRNAKIRVAAHRREAVRVARCALSHRPQRHAENQNRGLACRWHGSHFGPDRKGKSSFRGAWARSRRA